MPDTVSTIDAAARAELSYRQVSHWIAVGALTPAHGTGGSGNPYRFTEAQVGHLVQLGILCRMFRDLELFGPTTEFIRRVWESLEATGQFRWTEGPLVIQLPWPPAGGEAPSEPVA